jgi:hypothetical protein
MSRPARYCAAKFVGVFQVLLRAPTKSVRDRNELVGLRRALSRSLEFTVRRFLIDLCHRRAFLLVGISNRLPPRRS